MGFRSEVIFKREQIDTAKEMLYRFLAGIVIFGLVIGLVLVLLCKNDRSIVLGLF